MTKQEMIKVIQRKERILHGFVEFDREMLNKPTTDHEFYNDELIKDSREWYGIYSLMMELGIKPERKYSND